MKKFLFEDKTTREYLEEVASFLKDGGFSQDHAMNTIKENPETLAVSYAKAESPKDAAYALMLV